MKNDDVWVRRLDVTTRRGSEVGVDDGLLVETYIGRYVLNRDAGAIWRLLDGRRAVGDVIARLAADSGQAPEAISAAVTTTIERLQALRLVETK